MPEENIQNIKEHLNEIFDKERKIAVFDKLSEMMFYANFGSASKSEIELLMFSEFMEAMIYKYQESGVMDFNKCSSYNISKMLGITQERVQTLKLKKQARYPHEFDWKKSLLKIKDNIRYDETKGRVIIPTSDPNLYNEIRNFIEENGGYIDITRGANYLQMRPEYFIVLLCQTYSKKDKEQIIVKLKEENEKIDFTDYKTREERSEDALDIAKNFFDFVTELPNPLSPLFAVLKGAKLVTNIIKNNL